MNTYFSKLFLSHPRDVGETYLTHAGVAFLIAVRFLSVALKLAIHAIIPGVFTKTASVFICDMHFSLLRDTKRGADYCAQFKLYEEADYEK